jgi:hypothetical protein
VLDCDSVHRQEAMKQYAAELAIDLLSTLPGLTHERQPLDCFVFGAMKARSRRVYRTHAAAPFLIRTWQAVNAAVLNDTCPNLRNKKTDLISFLFVHLLSSLPFQYALIFVAFLLFPVFSLFFVFAFRLFLVF